MPISAVSLLPFIQSILLIRAGDELDEFLGLLGFCLIQGMTNQGIRNLLNNQVIYNILRYIGASLARSIRRHQNNALPATSRHIPAVVVLSSSTQPMGVKSSGLCVRLSASLYPFKGLGPVNKAIPQQVSTTLLLITHYKTPYSRRYLLKKESAFCQAS